MALTEKQVEKIVSMRGKGKPWAEIAEAVGTTQGKAMFEYEKETVPSKDRISGRTDDELNRKIVDARTGKLTGEPLSWGSISARSGKTEGYCRKVYEELTGESASGNRIGKGGRHPGAMGAQAAKAQKVAKKTAKASGVVKQAAKKAPAAAKKATAKKTTKKAAAKKTTAKKAAAA